MNVPLRSTVARGLSWSFLNAMVSRLGTLVSGIVLARILLPEDYGVFAVALVTMTALLSINELGVSLPLLRWDEARARAAAPTVATLCLVSSSVLFVSCLVLAPAFAALMNAPQATPLLRVLAVSVLLDAVTTVPNAWLTRGFRQRRRMGIDMVAFAASTTVALLLATVGDAGAWSLVLAYLVANLVTAVAMVGGDPTALRPGLDRTHLRAVLSFGLPLAGASAVNFAVLNVDYLIVGVVLGPVALGYYLLAFNLSSFPVNVISAATRRVSTAGFAALAPGREGAGAAFAGALRLVLTVAGPLCAVLAALAGPVVGVVYGEKWLPAAPALAFLVVLGLFRVLSDLAYDYLVAAGAGRASVLLQSLWLVVLVPVVWWSAGAGGFYGVAAGHAAVSVLLMAPATLVALSSADVPVGRTLRLALRPAVASLAAFAAAAVTVQLVDQPLGQLLLGTLAAGSAALLVLLPMRRELASTLALLRPDAAAV